MLLSVWRRKLCWKSQGSLYLPVENAGIWWCRESRLMSLEGVGNSASKCRPKRVLSSLMWFYLIRIKKYEGPIWGLIRPRPFLFMNPNFSRTKNVLNPCSNQNLNQTTLLPTCPTNRMRFIQLLILIETLWRPYSLKVTCSNKRARLILYQNCFFYRQAIINYIASLYVNMR